MDNIKCNKCGIEDVETTIKTNDIESIEITFSDDGLAVVISKEGISCLTGNELKQLICDIIAEYKK